jgi:hypothetical protein
MVRPAHLPTPYLLLFSSVVVAAAAAAASWLKTIVVFVMMTEAKTITLEHPLCYPFCTEVLSDCRGEFQLDDMEDQLPDCNATLPGTAGETMVYPPASQPYHYTLPDNTTTAYKCFVPGDKGSTLFLHFTHTHTHTHKTSY